MDDEELLNIATSTLTEALMEDNQPLTKAMYGLLSLAASSLVTARATMSRYDLEVAQWRGEPHR